MHLFDTNIFLELLLDQEKADKCQRFLNKNSESIHLSDFTLHSIGVILMRQKKSDIFLRFVADILPNSRVLSLPHSHYKNIVGISNSMKLDFDDAYQYLIALEFNLTIVTLDSDFKRVKDVKVKFL